MISKVKLRREKGEKRQSRQGHNMRKQNPPSPFPFPPSSAFTLIELLVVIGILGILSALILGVAAGAGERGREARTKAMIARLHTLVMEQYDTYKDRRAPLSDQVVSAINMGVNSRTRGAVTAEARLYALRELMIMEIPDRWSDVLLTGVVGAPASVSPRLPLYMKSTSSSFHRGPTPLIEAYRRQYYAIANGTNSLTGVANTIDNILDNQGAECLYMVVMFATADGEARSLFNEQSIGDVDGDGAPEFLDAWGRPINFLRWAPGFESDLQANANNYVDDTSWTTWISQADVDHDPFDLFRNDPFAFRVVPLIFSAGSDESYGLRTIKPSVTWRTANFALNSTTWGTQNRRTYIAQTSRVTPFQTFTGDSETAFYGTIRDDTAADNIHNHNITSE
ncbi:MAG: type II secretion system protein [Aeoliella sp.]